MNAINMNNIILKKNILKYIYNKIFVFKGTYIIKTLLKYFKMYN